jgi:hypothetical protein
VDILLHTEQYYVNVHTRRIPSRRCSGRPRLNYPAPLLPDTGRQLAERALLCGLDDSPAPSKMVKGCPSEYGRLSGARSVPVVAGSANPLILV